MNKLRTISPAIFDKRMPRKLLGQPTMRCSDLPRLTLKWKTTINNTSMLFKIIRRILVILLKMCHRLRLLKILKHLSKWFMEMGKERCLTRTGSLHIYVDQKMNSLTWRPSSRSGARWFLSRMMKWFWKFWRSLKVVVLWQTLATQSTTSIRPDLTTECS